MRIVLSNVLNEFITESEVHESIKTLKLNKSSGIDDIVNEYILQVRSLINVPLRYSQIN